MGTVGLCSEAEADAGVMGFAATAVCIRPGTELAFEGKIKRRWSYEGVEDITEDPRTAIFRQINKDNLMKHHDCLEFPNGQQLLLNLLEEGQVVTVLQLPASPKTEAEAKEQERLPAIA